MTRGTERFSQTNLSDDVYDGIFAELRISDPDGNELYGYAPPILEVEETAVDRFLDKLSGLFNWARPRQEDGEL